MMCEWPEDRIAGLHERGELSYYVVRAIFNMVTNKYHPFHKKYRSTNIEYKEILAGSYIDAIENNEDFWQPCRLDKREPADESDGFEDSERAIKELREDFAIDEINNLNWYNAELIRLYMDLGNYRALQRVTGIPYSSCYKTIQKSLEILRNKALAPKPVFSKQELNFIQNANPKNS